MGEDEVESSEWEDVDEDDLVEAEVDLDSYAPVDNDDSNIGHGVAYEDGDEQMEDGNKEDESESSNIPNFTLNAHNGAVYSVAVILGTTGGLVLTGGGDDKALLWKLPRPEPGFVHQPIYLEQHGDSVAACEFSADGTLAASGGYDGAVNVSTVPSGGKVQELKGPSEVEWIAWHPQVIDGYCFQGISARAYVYYCCHCCTGKCSGCRRRRWDGMDVACSNRGMHESVCRPSRKGDMWGVCIFWVCVYSLVRPAGCMHPVSLTCSI